MNFAKTLAALLVAAGVISCGSPRGGGFQAPSAHHSSSSLANDPSPAHARIRRVLFRLTGHHDTAFRITASAAPNAVCFPGGHIEVSTGLLNFCRSDDELAFVLAHELAHFRLRHPQERRATGWARLLFTAVAGLESLPAAAVVLAVSELLALRPQMRRMEYDADAMALETMCRAGYDGRAAAAFWRRYAKERPDRPRPEWWSEHPSDAHRAARLSHPPAAGPVKRR